VSVCLVPFAVNELTDRVCPVKLFEYWALGKPVIGTPCRELARLAQESPEALHLAADVEATVRLLNAFRENPELLASSSRSALEEVKAYDWRELGKRFERLLALSQPAN
jgi:glycosyltransferase involved in cell wall biosynthesis